MTFSLARCPNRAYYLVRGERTSLPPANTGPAGGREAGWNLRPGPSPQKLVLFHAVFRGVPRTQRPRPACAPRRVARRYAMTLTHQDGFHAGHVGVAYRRHEIVEAFLPGRPRVEAVRWQEGPSSGPPSSGGLRSYLLAWTAALSFCGGL